MHGNQRMHLGAYMAERRRAWQLTLLPPSRLAGRELQVQVANAGRERPGSQVRP